MRKRQSSVTTDTQYPVRSIGADALGVVGVWPPRPRWASRTGIEAGRAAAATTTTTHRRTMRLDRTLSRIPPLRLGACPRNVNTLLVEAVTRTRPPESIRLPE